MSRITACLGLCLLLTCGVLPMLAQQPVANATNGSNVVVPPLVNFSSVLTDLNGKPLTGITGVTFLLYKEGQGGAPLWMETQNVQPDKTGHYSVMLGSTTSTGLPSNLFVAGEARWLAMQPQGQAEQPRVMLLSVPYALKAGDAATVGGLQPSAFVLAAPGGASARTSSSSAAKKTEVAPNLAGSGTQNYIPLWTDSKGDLGNSLLFQSGSNVNLTAGGGFTINGTQDGTGNTLIPNQLLFQDNGEIASHDANHRIIFDRANNVLELREYGNIVFSPGSTGPRTSRVTFPSVGGITVNGTQDGSGNALIPNQLFFQDNGEIASHDANHRIIFDRAGNNLELREYGNIVFSSGSTGQRTGTVTISSGNQTVNGNSTATGVVTGSSFQIGSNLFAFGSYAKANAFLGFAGNAWVTGQANTAIGSQALLNNTTGWFNTACGVGAMELNTTGGLNTACGVGALGSNTTGFGNTADGYEALGGNTTGSYNTALGYGAGPGTGTNFNSNFTNATAIGAYATVSQNNALVLGSINGVRGATSSVNVGIGTATPSNVFTIAQNAGHAISDAWDTYSSRRWKTNIQTLHGALAKVEQLRGVSYDLKETGKHEVGVIAEEVGAVVPEIVSWDKNGKEAQGVDYGRLTALLIEATKEQQREFRQQQAIVRTQAAAISNLKSELRATRQSLQKVKAQVAASQLTVAAK